MEQAAQIPNAIQPLEKPEGVENGEEVIDLENSDHEEQKSESSINYSNNAQPASLNENPDAKQTVGPEDILVLSHPKAEGILLHRCICTNIAFGITFAS